MGATGTVAATPAAVAAARQFQQIINSDLVQSLQSLEAQGNVLADGTDFQGPLAAQFQEIWSGMPADFNKMINDLTELGQRVQQILAAIIQAGGG